jgi:hypothetical protein
MRPNSGWCNLTAAEHDGDLDLVALLKESLGVSDLDLKVMLLRLGAHLDFLDLDPSRLLLSLGRALARLILVLAVIHDRQTGGTALGETSTRSRPRPPPRPAPRSAENTELMPFIIDDPNLAGADGTIDVCFWLGYGNTS